MALLNKVKAYFVFSVVKFDNVIADGLFSFNFI